MRLDLIHAYPEQIDLLKEMGVRNVFFGIESLHDPSSKAIGKGFGREKTIEMIHRLKEAWGKEVFLHGSFIVGLPHETPDTAADANFRYPHLIYRPAQLPESFKPSSTYTRQLSPSDP